MKGMVVAYHYEEPLNGQVAIVTGAGQGIGRAVALRLAQDGMHVVVADLQGAQAEAVASEIRKLGVTALAVAMDVGYEVERQELLAATLREYKRLDVLVNNAGIQRVSDPLYVTEEHWDSMMSVNAKAVWFLCQAALHYMLPQKRGRIVNLASIAGKMASTLYHPVYNVAKASVIAMTKTFAHAAAPHGVRVNCVCPGVIATAMQDRIDVEFSKLADKTAEQIRADRMARIPMGTVGDPQEVADVVAFLAGPDSRYMTGQAINVSGGMVMW
jgi:meso-butanediol dehydrogenase / (S,S)-butanediol dehydrogenase / diacetyl reductase